MFIFHQFIFHIQIYTSKNMDFMKKDSASDTTESFSQRVPLGDRNMKNITYNSHIQQLTATLVQRKGELRQAKTKQDNLSQKSEQQDVRINKINIAIDHEIQKERLIKAEQQKLRMQINAVKDSIKDLNIRVRTAKTECSDALQDILQAKKNKSQIQKKCTVIKSSIENQANQNSAIDKFNQELQTLIIGVQNESRSKQDQLAKLQIQKVDLVNKLENQEQALKEAVREKNNTQNDCNQLKQLMLRGQQKLNNMKKDKNQMDWNCQQLRGHNVTIQNCNKRLASDLEGVQKHLETMEKMNKLLQNSLAEYGLTGDRVSRMLTAVKQ